MPAAASGQARPKPATSVGNAGRAVRVRLAATEHSLAWVQFTCAEEMIALEPSTCHAETMRFLYNCLLYLIGPLIFVRLWWRGRWQPDYRKRLGERLGFIPKPPGSVAIWIHAVSVGESIAAIPLIEALIGRNEGRHIWVTTTTPTGSARISAALGSRVLHSYAPYDWPGSVARFLRKVRPSKIVIMETEIWPNLFRAASRAGIPLVIANARLSPRSYRGYRRLQGAIHHVLADCRLIAAQSLADAERFSSLGAPNVQSIGNLKFDLGVPKQQVMAGHRLRAAFGINRPVWVAASTHEGEEEAVLAAHRVILDSMPDALLVLVPRHPERFQAVWALIQQKGFHALRRSTTDDDQPSAGPIYLGDTMGEMHTYLAAADVAFVGGSLVGIGGHNVLEPAALGLPVLFGPHMHNFEEARTLLTEAGAAIQVNDSQSLAFQVRRLFADPELREKLGNAGREKVEKNRGALARLLQAIDDL